MTALDWSDPEGQTYEAGVDRGVLYLEDGRVAPWIGLINVNQEGTADTREFFIDGQKYLSTVSARDWKGAVSAYTYPDEFAEALGIAQIGAGLYADSQVPLRFSFSYRTMISTPSQTTQHYKIHIVYQAIAKLGDEEFETLTADGTDPSTFTFDISAVPQTVPGFRPTAHFIVDTRELTPEALANIEKTLYGDSTTDPMLIPVTELLYLLDFGLTVVIIDNGDGTWTATGPDEYFTEVEPGIITIDNVKITPIDANSYTISNTE